MMTSVSESPCFSPQWLRGTLFSIGEAGQDLWTRPRDPNSLGGEVRPQTSCCSQVLDWRGEGAREPPPHFHPVFSNYWPGPVTRAPAVVPTPNWLQPPRGHRGCVVASWMPSGLLHVDGAL